MTLIKTKKQKKKPKKRSEERRKEIPIQNSQKQIAFFMTVFIALTMSSNFSGKRVS